MMIYLDNQHSAIVKLNKYKVGALFMEPGTGKSRIAVELAESAHTDAIIWFAPFGSINNSEGIVKEVKKWASKPFTFFAIESFSNSDRLYLEVLELVQSKNCFLVLDESLKVKNWEAKRTKRLIKISGYCEYKLILNGTPLSKNILDLWAQMEFLSPRILSMSLTKFKNTFCEYTTVSKKIGNSYLKKEWINKYHNIDYLYALIQNYVFESKLNLVIQQKWETIDFQICDDEFLKYTWLKDTYLDNEVLEIKNNNIFLEMATKMQHVYAVSDQKFQKIDSIILKHGIENIVVFTKFVLSKSTLCIKYPNLMVLSYQKESMSLNLQSKHVTVFFEYTWDYATVEQAVHRTFRNGQNNHCFFYRLKSNTGLDAMIEKNISNKKSMLDYLRFTSTNQLKKDL